MIDQCVICFVVYYKLFQQQQSAMINKTNHLLFIYSLFLKKLKGAICKNLSAKYIYIIICFDQMLKTSMYCADEISIEVSMLTS